MGIFKLLRPRLQGARVGLGDLPGARGGHAPCAGEGFAVGGEWGGAALMAVESAPPKLEALFSSGVQVGYSVGLLLATGAVGVMQALTSDAAFQAWGWRIPFLLSVVFVAVALWIRAGVPESDVFRKQVAEQAPKQRKLPVLDALRQHPQRSSRSSACGWVNC
ncbi:MFS transporter [Salinifilum ghardaiensis]